MSTTDLTQLTTDPLTSGQAALSRGAWEEARSFFEAALSQQETPEALEGLSWVAWWLSEAEATFKTREQAYRLYRGRGDRRNAARMALWIGADYFDFRGETAIANGWRQRAKRLLNGLEPTAERGWIAVHEAISRSSWKMIR